MKTDTKPPVPQIVLEPNHTGFAGARMAWRRKEPIGGIMQSGDRLFTYSHQTGDETKGRHYHFREAVVTTLAA